MKTSELIDILDRLLDGASRVLRLDMRKAPPFEEVEPYKVNSHLVNFWMKKFPLGVARNKAKDPITRTKVISWMIKDKQIRASGAVGARRLDLFEEFWDRHENGEVQHETLKTWLRNARGLEALGSFVGFFGPEASSSESHVTLSAVVMEIIRKHYLTDENEKNGFTGKGASSGNRKPPDLFNRFKPMNAAIRLVYDLEPFTPQELEILFSAEPHAFQDEPLKNIESENASETSNNPDEQYLIWLEGAEFIWEVLKEEEKIRDEVSPKHEY